MKTLTKIALVGGITAGGLVIAKRSGLLDVAVEKATAWIGDTVANAALHLAEDDVTEAQNEGADYRSAGMGR